MSKEELKENILTLNTNSEILEVIKKLGEESIAGFSGVTEEEVPEVLELCHIYELADIIVALTNKK